MFVWLQTFFYKLTNGKIGGRFRGGPVLLLTTVGRKTGKRRTTPVLYIVDQNRWVLCASNGGRPKDPSWWFNLKKNPQAEIQVGKEMRKVSARQATADEKGKFWPLLAKMYPGYDNYQKKTDRQIPVVILETSAST